MFLRQVSLFAFVLLHLVTLEYFACLIEAKSLGFTVDMIHRDSPLSPLYDPLQTPMEQYQKAISRSINRLHRYNLNGNLPESQVVLDVVEYLIKFSVGSPPTENYGSDLTWVQCTPCKFCTKQRFPIFNPERSITYKDLPCTSKQCQWLQHVCSGNGSNTSNTSCEYTYAYGGGSYTIGNLATETLTLTSSSSGQPFPLLDIVIGCGHNNTDLSLNETGILGLGGGPLSLVNQIGSYLGSRKLTQCLVPINTSPSISSKLTFGIDKTSKGKGVVSTPLVPKEPSTYLFVTLKGFSVLDKFVPFNALNSTVQEGNMFLDSGSFQVSLPQDFYNRLRNEVKGAIPLEPIPDSPQLCYQSNETQMNVPVITAHFEGGGNLGLPPTNTFIPVGNGVYCFTMANTTSEIGVIGNFAQSNFLIGFDFDSKIVSFEPKDCTKNDQ